MPSVAQETPTVPSCKKRRRDDGDHAHNHNTTPQISLYANDLARSTFPIPDHLFRSPASHLQNNHYVNTPLSARGIHPEKTFDHGSLFHQHHSSPFVRKIIPLPSIKRQRISGDDDREPLDDHSMRPRSSPQRQQQQAKLQEKRSNSRPTTPPRITADTANLMTRCHICFRKPAKKSDLDSFADCQGCHQRTCYVCIRECLGWGRSLRVDHRGGMPFSDPKTGEGRLAAHSSPISDASFTMLDVDDVSELGTGNDERNYQVRNHRPQESDGWASGGHRQMVCSRCCVERGQDGDVVCLGCMPFVEG